MTTWLAPLALSNRARSGLAILLALSSLCVAILLCKRRSLAPRWRLLAFISIITGSYLLALAVSLSVFDASTPLDNRVALPILRRLPAPGDLPASSSPGAQPAAGKSGSDIMFHLGLPQPIRSGRQISFKGGASRDWVIHPPDGYILRDIRQACAALPVQGPISLTTRRRFTFLPVTLPAACCPQLQSIFPATQSLDQA